MKGLYIYNSTHACILYPALSVADILSFIRNEIESQSAIEKAKCEVRRTPSFSGPLMLPNRASANSLSAPIKSSEDNDHYAV